MIPLLIAGSVRLADLKYSCNSSGSLQLALTSCELRPVPQGEILVYPVWKEKE